MSVTDPNPTTNPAVELECINCKNAGYATPTWIWHVPEGGGPTGLGTEVGGFNDYDPSKPDEINVNHPHCPYCGSHAVRVVRTIEPS